MKSVILRLAQLSKYPEVCLGKWGTLLAQSVNEVPTIIVRDHERFAVAPRLARANCANNLNN